ncbi:MAG TPA: ABC transporter permease [Actinoplanes sp.]|jgi:hypothetical protein
MTAQVDTAIHSVRWHRVHTAEWWKLTSLRSSWYLVAAVLVAVAGSGAFVALGVALGGLEATVEDVGPLGGALSGIGLAEMIVAALGILAVTGEYASTAIRSSFIAVPRRDAVVFGKAAVVAEIALAVGLGSVAVAYGITRGVLARAGFELSLTAPGVARALGGAVLYLALVGALGVGLGWLLRSTAGALTTFLGLFYGLPIVGLVLPLDVAAIVLPYLPGNAGGAIMQMAGPGGMLPPWAGLAVFAGYTLIALVGAAFVVRRRDV